MSPLERKVNRGILEHAVGVAITCPSKGCGTCLDARDAVLFTRCADGAAGISCGQCAAPLLERLERLELAADFEVIRGADLW